MATMKQKLMPKKIMENNGNVSKAMKQVGYSDNYSKNPQTLVNSKGFIEVIEQLGLTKELVIDALKDDIRNKPKNRATELQLGAKILGLLSDKIDITSNNQQITGFNFIRNESNETKKDE